MPPRGGNNRQKAALLPGTAAPSRIPGQPATSAVESVERATRGASPAVGIALAGPFPMAFYSFPATANPEAILPITSAIRGAGLLLPPTGSIWHKKWVDAHTCVNEQTTAYRRRRSGDPRAAQRVPDPGRFEVLTAAEGNEMRQQLAQHSPDLIILDIMMPGDDGFTLCQQIRRDSQVPIIMLTAASDEADRVIGLELGADDYIAKPFSPRELQARIQGAAAPRRIPPAGERIREPSRRLRFAEWTLDTLSHQLTHEDGGSLLDLSGSDALLLGMFLLQPGVVLDGIPSRRHRGRESRPWSAASMCRSAAWRQKLGDNGKRRASSRPFAAAGFTCLRSPKSTDPVTDTDATVRP